MLSPGSSVYYSIRFAPADKRAGLTALHAFINELHQLALPHHTATIALHKLFWWREEIGRLAKGQPQHPLTRALLPLTLPQDLLEAVITGVEMDIEITRYPSSREFDLYLMRNEVSPLLLAAHIVDAHDPSLHSYITSLGIGIGVLRKLRHLHRDLQRGRLYFPLDTLEKYQLTVNELFSTPHFSLQQPFFAAEMHRAETQLNHFLTLTSPDRSRLIPHLILAKLNIALLNAMKKSDSTQAIALTPLHKLWIAFRTR